MDCLITGPCLQLATEIVAKLQRGADFVAQNDLRALSCCMQQLNEYGESLGRIILRLGETELKHLLIKLHADLLEFVITNETRVGSEEISVESLTPQHSAPLKISGGGRPSYQISLEEIKNYRIAGLSWKQIARNLGISRKTLYRRCKGRSIQSVISDQELENIILELKEEDAFCGEPYISGELRARGHRVPRQKVRQILRVVDPVGTVRRLRTRTKRRKYNVRGPNYLWHIDGNEKLQPYKLYIHGAVDGFSRKVMYLKVASDKKALTVGEFFKTAAFEFGLPRRARADKGRENVDIARIMLEHRGTTGGAYITGRSVHNVRIERFWKEVNRITYRFKILFGNLSQEGLLNEDDEEQLFYLHYLFIPQIQKFLSKFQLRWDSHKIRTASHRTPNDLYMSFAKAPIVPCAFTLPDERACHIQATSDDEQIWLERATRLIPNPLIFDEFTAVLKFTELCTH